MTTYAPRHVDIWPWTQAKSQTNWNSRVQASGDLGLGRLYGGAATSTVTWSVALDAGTWTLTVIYRSSTSGDTAVAVTLGGSSVATINMSGGNTSNLVSTTTGIVVASPGVYDLTFTQSAAKDASLHLITLTRTGA